MKKNVQRPIVEAHWPVTRGLLKQLGGGTVSWEQPELQCPRPVYRHIVAVRMRQVGFREGIPLKSRALLQKRFASTGVEIAANGVLISESETAENSTYITSLRLQFAILSIAPSKKVLQKVMFWNPLVLLLFLTIKSPAITYSCTQTFEWCQLLCQKNSTEKKSLLSCSLPLEYNLKYSFQNFDSDKAIDSRVLKIIPN